MTQMDAARAGIITVQIRQVAEDEGRSPEFVLDGVAQGRIAIPANVRHVDLGLHACGVGAGLKTKVNVNLGISGDIQNAPQLR